jgi:hypothetical protein
VFTLHRFLLTAGMVLLASTGVATAAVTIPVRPVGITASDSAVAAAGAFIEQRPARVDGADADELVVAGQERGAGGTTIVRFDQELHGVPVLGGEVVVALDAKRRVLAADAEVIGFLIPAQHTPAQGGEGQHQIQPQHQPVTAAVPVGPGHQQTAFSANRSAM